MLFGLLPLSASGRGLGGGVSTEQNVLSARRLAAALVYNSRSQALSREVHLCPAPLRFRAVP